MTTVVDIVAFLGGLLGVIGFAKENVPDQKAVGSTIRVTVGLDAQGGLNNAGGDLPDIRLFNEAGGFLGMVADPGKVKSGSFGDITVKHDDRSGQQATYALFSANNDAICIAYTSITWPSGDHYAWVGDWGEKCGGHWYYSNVYLAGSGIRPECFWIDANNDEPQTGFQIHWPEFVKKPGDPIPASPIDKNPEVDYICNSGVPFKMHTYPDKDPHSINYWPPTTGRRSLPENQMPDIATSYGPPKHSLSARFQSSQGHSKSNQTTTSQRMKGSLVIGDDVQHSAEGLCASATSSGPDFLNKRTGVFCRMSDKTTWPVCDGLATDNCFNNDLHQLVINGVASRDEPYTNIIDWTSEN
ncbi:hypothetical protein GGS24DRAFT_517375 [Hypoxylon argillaceum]|nr:hypothetical protein GGS24DRAFT_517375 [Hypoxylon argillaceum]